MSENSKYWDEQAAEFDEAPDHLDRWLELLRPGGRLVLIEGCWWTAAGLAGDHVLRLLQSRGREATLATLDDPVLWGGPVHDERYLVISPP